MPFRVRGAAAGVQNAAVAADTYDELCQIDEGACDGGGENASTHALESRGSPISSILMKHGRGTAGGTIGGISAVAAG